MTIVLPFAELLETQADIVNDRQALASRAGELHVPYNRELAFLVGQELVMVRQALGRKGPHGIPPDSEVRNRFRNSRGKQTSNREWCWQAMPLEAGKVNEFLLLGARMALFCGVKTSERTERGLQKFESGARLLTPQGTLSQYDNVRVRFPLTLMRVGLANLALIQGLTADDLVMPT